VEACYLGEQVWSIEKLEKMKVNPDKKAYQSYLQQQLISSKEQGEELEDIEEVEEKLENWLSEMDEGKQTLEILRVQLCDRSLLQEIAQDDYRLHPLIREFLQTKQGEIENIDDCKRDICRVMVEIAKEIPSTITLEVIQSTTAYIPHLREVGENLMKWVEDENLIRPFIVLGRIYKGQSQFTEAEKWYKKSVKVTRDRLGKRHPLVATSYNNLAALYSSMGRYEEALPLDQNALEIRLEQLGERHPDVATSYNNLAELYRAMGRYEEALPLFQNALEILLEQLGERHPSVATSYNNLAGLYSSMGRYEEALPLYQKALEIRLEQLGERHPDVAQSYNNLAGLYKSMGRYEEAIAHYQQAMSIANRH
jgi:tetratricopeptide (TPR) repeat protein